MHAVSRALIAVVVLAGCGGKPPAPAPAHPAPVAVTPPPAPAAPVAVPVAPVSCADAGVLLAREFAAYDDAMVTKHEAEIAKACTDGHWPQAVLDCVGEAVSSPGSCVEQLSHEQQVALVGSVTAVKPPQTEAPPPEEEKYTSCEDAVHVPAAFGDAPTWSPEDSAFVVALRTHRVIDACNNDNWPEPAKECFAAVQDISAADACARKLPDQAQTGLATAILGALDLSARTFEARKTAANVTCAKVVAKHYADATWKDKLTKVKPAAKKAAVTASRGAMAKACAADAWSPTVRACVLVGGDFPECSMKPSGVDPWGYPAFGVLVPTGVPECDKYLGVIQKFAECPAAKEMRDALLAAMSSATQTISGTPDESRKVMGEACTQGMGAISDEAAKLGCKL